MKFSSFFYEIRDTATNSHIKNLVVNDNIEYPNPSGFILGTWFKSENGSVLSQIKSKDNSLIATLRSEIKKNNI
tara:strand:- start:875 stop:1096 length:222 start_codon:yes stop_codon:yes gene_type:complete